MNETPASLLERLREPNEHAAWSQFVKLYTPLIYRWAQRSGMPPQEAFDLVQDVFVVLVQKMPEFQYDHSKSFRAWLRTITVNKWRDRCRRATAGPKVGSLDGAEPVDDGEPAWWSETEYRQQLVAQAMESLRPEIQPGTWNAFWAVTVEGRPAAQVAIELGVSVNSIYLARSRVLRRLRTELDRLLD
jgi:RNA polymerase sigma-70 factor, ECF subfamily